VLGGDFSPGDTVRIEVDTDEKLRFVGVAGAPALEPVQVTEVA
jgi:hypothetical protein